MSAETCIRSQCPEMPKVTLDQAVIDLMESIALQEAAVLLTSKALCLPGCRAGIFVYRLFTESLHKNRKMHLLELLRRSICAIL